MPSARLCPPKGNGEQQARAILATRSDRPWAALSGLTSDPVDHVCQIAGNANHAAIGTDLDGGYGKEQVPRDLDTIAGIQKIPDLLRKRGYSEADIRAVMHGNWIRFFQEAWTDIRR